MSSGESGLRGSSGAGAGSLAVLRLLSVSCVVIGIDLVSGAWNRPP